MTSFISQNDAFYQLQSKQFPGNPCKTPSNAKDTAEWLSNIHYAALVNLACHRFPLASTQLSQCIHAPRISNSTIQLSAFKKLCLVNAILFKPMLQYKHSSQCVPYVDLHDAILDINFSLVSRLLELHHRVFEKDGNSGLVMQAKNSGIFM